MDDGVAGFDPRKATSAPRAADPEPDHRREPECDNASKLTPTLPRGTGTHVGTSPSAPATAVAYPVVQCRVPLPESHGISRFSFCITCPVWLSVRNRHVTASLVRTLARCSVSMAVASRS
jgi:hypothetical protein